MVKLTFFQLETILSLFQIHIQHATIAGGIAIGSVADLNVQIYIALIVGAIAGLLSTVGYQYLDVSLNFERLEWIFRERITNLLILL